MHSHETEQTEGPRIARGIAKAGAIIGGTMLAASCSALFIREVEELSIDPNQAPHTNPIPVEHYDDVIELSTQVGLAGLGVAVVGLIANSAVHAIQRRRLNS